MLLDTDNLIFAKEMSNKYPNLHIHNRSSNFLVMKYLFKYYKAFMKIENITEDFRYTILLQPTSQSGILMKLIKL